MISLDGHKITIDDIAQIARYHVPLKIHQTALKRMKASRAFVEKISGNTQGVYGINTGFGALSRTRISPEDYGSHQLHLIHHLSVGQGNLFSEEETRAIMVARANALSRGYSGIRPVVVNRLIDFLNSNVLPEIPMEGSVGASGDLIPLAHMTRAVIGLGNVRKDGKRQAVELVEKANNWERITLLEKEGLAMVNGTSVMTGLASLCAYDAQNILSMTELLGSFFVQALYGEPEPFCHRVAFARGHRGQSVVSDRIAEHLRSNPFYREKIDSHKWGTYSKPIEAGTDVQDPYSIRCVPQILGAFQDALWHIQNVVTQEINSTTDNPVIFPKEEMVIHCGNFYGQHISMVMDYLRLGLAKTALLVERQIERLVNEKYNLGMPAMLTKGRLGLNSGFMGCQLLATALAAEVRLATPASIQTIPTNGNNQDVVSMGTHSAKMTRAMIPLVWKILGIKALLLSQAYDIRNDVRIQGKKYKKFHSEIRGLSCLLVEDRPLFEELAKVTEKISDSNFIKKFC